MKPVLTMCVLSTLILSACAEESARGIQYDPESPTVNPEPVTPEPVTPEPVTPEPVTPEPVTPEPFTPGPVTPEPVTPEPVTPEPVTPEPITPQPVEPGGSSAALINGEDLQSIDSYWYCEDYDEPEVPTELAFFADGQIVLAEGDLEEYMDWELEGGAVNLFQDSQFIVQLSDFQWSADNRQFTTSYAFYNGSSGSLNCEKLSVNDDALVVQTVEEPEPSESGDELSGEQAYILNALVNGELADVWACQTSTGDSLWFAFLTGGQGELLEDNYYPDGIDYSWDFSGEDVLMSLSDGNQVQLTNAMIGSDYLDSDSLLMNGGQAGSVTCDRVSVF